MRTTLIFPGIVGYGFGSLGQNMEAGWMSHGLCAISAAAKAQGFQVDLIDLRALSGWEHFREEVVARRPHLCGLTMKSVDYNPVMQCIEIIKQVDPSIVTVVGGPHPTILPQEVLDNPRVDYAITGEGEIAFPDLLRRIQEEDPPQERLTQGLHPDLDAQPFPDRDLFLEEWRKFGYGLDSPEVPFVPELPPPFVTVIAGRGCFYNCNFCKPAEDLIFGRGTRRRSVASIIAELRQLQERFHFRSFMFHDDCLTEDRRWVAEFCDAYPKAGFTQPFFCQSRADIIVRHQDMVQRMVEVGLRGYFIGFESGSDRVLNFLRKGTKVSQNLEAARICKRYGIKIWANYMLGIPTETEEELMQTVRMMKRIDPDYYSPSFFTPYPGCDLYDYCREQGLTLISDHDGYRRNPTEPKIRGLDPEFLNWACTESQRRTLWNALKRKLRYLWKRYASPQKVVRKLKTVLAGAPSRGEAPLPYESVKR